jgi:hypothetical protein
VTGAPVAAEIGLGAGLLLVGTALTAFGRRRQDQLPNG